MVAVTGVDASLDWLVNWPGSVLAGPARAELRVLDHEHNPRAGR
jgi:hypothetical protein